MWFFFFRGIDTYRDFYAYTNDAFSFRVLCTVNIKYGLKFL